MDTLTEKISQIIAPINYTISGGLFFSNWVHYLNENAGAFGVILGFMTFFAQLYFGTKRQEILVKKLEVGCDSTQARRKTDNLNNGTF